MIPGVQVIFDTVTQVQPAPVAPAPQPRPAEAGAATAARQRDRNRGQDSGERRGASFKATLGDVTGRADAGARTTAAGGRASAAGSAAPVRPERFPATAPAAIDQTIGAEVLRPAMAPPLGEFAEAAGEYAARFYSTAAAYARPGENLELTA
jgi:hypothetical protein